MMIAICIPFAISISHLFSLCEIKYDVFRFMKENSIKYGWIMQFFESPITAADSLWEATNKVPFHSCGINNSP
jgi:hypothetical protein